MARLVGALRFADASSQSSAAGALGSVYSNGELAVAAAAVTAFTAANGTFYVPIQIRMNTTLTGLRYKKGTGTTTATNTIGALFNAAGTRVALSSTVAAGVVASAVVTLPFTATYAAAAGLYWAALIGSSTSGDVMAYASTNFLGPSTTATQGSFAAPTTFTPPALTALTTVATPFVSTY